MMKFLMFGLIAVSLAQAGELKPNKNFSKDIDHCAAPKESKAPAVVLMKQWHLLPSVNTRTSKEVPPQAANQTAIYLQLDEWVKNNSKLVVLAEGCGSGTEIKKGFATSFNGWSLDQLAAESSKPDFAKKLAHPALKIEARYGDKVSTFCSDDEELIKESQLALSDSRADSSYLSRLQEYKKDPERVKIYLEGAIEAYQLPKNSTVDQAITKIKSVLNDDIKKFQSLTEKRSLKLAEFANKLAKEMPESKIVAIWGGLHTAKLKSEFEKFGLNCSILEPNGYNQDEEKLIATLERLLK